MNIELTSEQVDRVLNGLAIAAGQMEDQDGADEMTLLGQVIFKQMFNQKTIACPHTVMIAIGDKAYSWKCAQCGYPIWKGKE